jgi:metal-dependent HD superfamily phosphatase/phosphodiesterase
MTKQNPFEMPHVANLDVRPGIEQPAVVTVDDVKGNPEVQALVNKSDEYLGIIGYTDHGINHVSRVSDRAYQIIRELELPEREAHLAGIAGYLHDIGNVVHRHNHAYVSALLSYSILSKMGMSIKEITVIMGAIGNHDESDGDPINNPCAALIIADKSDVLRSRVRNPRMINFDIHDRVNYAAEESEVVVDRKSHLITLKLKIDTNISQVMEYFEIFMSRMTISRRSANYLNCDFGLIINDIKLL